MYQTCIFDLYGTLVDIHTDEEQAILWKKMALFYGFYEAYYTPEALRDAYKKTIEVMEEGKTAIRKDGHEAFPEIQIEQVFLRLFEAKGVAADRTLAVQAGHFFRVLSMDYIRLYEGTEKMLQTIRESGKKLYLLSNAQRIFTEYEMKALGIFKYFDGIFISSDFSFKKPDVRFFEKLLDTYDISKASAIMVGNDGICDIKGAKDAGLHTLYIHSNISPKEELPDADYVLEEMDMQRVTEILMQE
jgi:putative hydrolase of the HAD superfamily